MSFLAYAVDVVADPDVQRSALEVVVIACGGLTTIAGAFYLVWRVAIKHHVEKFVREVSAVHKSVTVNGGKNSPPTLRDDISDLRSQVSQLVTQGGAIAQRTSDLGDRIDIVQELVTDTREDLRRHEERGEQYLGKVQLVFREQGIELPGADD